MPEHQNIEYKQILSDVWGIEFTEPVKMELAEEIEI